MLPAPLCLQALAFITRFDLGASLGAWAGVPPGILSQGLEMELLSWLFVFWDKVMEGFA